MQTLLVVLCSVAIVVGLIGVVLPILPGLALIGASVLVWAIFDDGSPAWRWTSFTVVAVLLVLGTVVKYAWPGKRLKDSKVPRSTLLVGAVLAIVGFFLIPVVGAVLGFVLGIFLAELQRMGATGIAWSSTRQALRAVGLSILIEFAAGLLAAGAFTAGAIGA